MADSEDLFRAAQDRQQAVCVAEQYDAGYQAYLRGEPEFQTATTSWRAGWWDAAREVRVDGKAQGALLDESAPALWTTEEAAESARVCELPFEEGRCEAWKRTWVRTDILLGLRGRPVSLA